VRPVVVDASALAALVFDEPGAEEVAGRLEGCRLYAPPLLKYELANVAWKKARRHPEVAGRIARALRVALDRESWISWMDVDHADALLVARATGLTAYDASYLWLAGYLGAELVTLDTRLAAALEPA
jgi:predicted nucleic acid-binding protein